MTIVNRVKLEKYPGVVFYGSFACGKCDMHYNTIEQALECFVSGPHKPYEWTAYKDAQV